MIVYVNRILQFTLIKRLQMYILLEYNVRITVGNRSRKQKIRLFKDRQKINLLIIQNFVLLVMMVLSQLYIPSCSLDAFW